MHLWAPYITRSTCWANSKISFISVSCKVSTEKWRPRVVLVFCSRFFYAPSNDWNSTRHWFVSKVVGLHHWIGWRLKFFLLEEFCTAKWVTRDPSGWWHTIFFQTVEYSLALLLLQYMQGGNGMLIQASCPASLQGGIRIHGDAWKGILIQASPPASLRDSCGCLEWDPHSCILSCLIKRWNWHLCFQRQNKPDDSTGVLILQVDPLLLVPGKRVHPNKEVPRKLHPCQSHSLASKGNHKIYVYVRSILWHTFGPTEIWSILPDILVDGWK